MIHLHHLPVSPLTLTLTLFCFPPTDAYICSSFKGENMKRKNKFLTWRAVRIIIILWLSLKIEMSAEEWIGSYGRTNGSVVLILFPFKENLWQFCSPAYGHLFWWLIIILFFKTLNYSYSCYCLAKTGAKSSFTDWETWGRFTWTYLKRFATNLSTLSINLSTLVTNCCSLTKSTFREP